MASGGHLPGLGDGQADVDRRHPAHAGVILERPCRGRAGGVRAPGPPLGRIPCHDPGLRQGRRSAELPAGVGWHAGGGGERCRWGHHKRRRSRRGRPGRSRGTARLGGRLPRWRPGVRRRAVGRRLRPRGPGGTRWVHHPRRRPPADGRCGRRGGQQPDHDRRRCRPRRPRDHGRSRHPGQCGRGTSSYFEWAQSLQGYAWDSDLVAARLHERIESAFINVRARAEALKTPLREAAFVLALERVAEAIGARGLFP